MQKRSVQIYPSILSGDFGHLAEEAKRLEAAGADAIHFDVMDGHFVPNLTLGPKALAAIRKAAPRIFLDVHLMIYNPFSYVESFVAAGADRITFHIEATEDVKETIEFIHKCGKKVGLALRPETSFSMVERYLGLVDLVLLMTVNPGFGGQKFMPEVVEKVEIAKAVLDLRKAPLHLQVDGGINLETAKECVKAGANILVSGDYLFKQKDMKQAIGHLRDV